MFASLYGHLDLALMLVVTAAAVYFNDRMGEFLSKDSLITRVLGAVAPSDLFWPVAIIALGALMWMFIWMQMAISSLFVLGYGIFLIRKARSLVRA